MERNEETNVFKEATPPINAKPLTNFNSPPIEKSLKRKHDLSDDGCNVPAKAMSLSNSGTVKNALCLLHELYRDIDFQIINQEGPVHAPIFTVSVEINGIVFEGKGKSKKTAKHKAAEAALRSLIQFKNPSSEGPTFYNPSELMDFTNDVSCREANDFCSSKVVGKTIVVPNGETNGLPSSCNISPGKSKPINPKLLNFYKNPIMLLNEIYPKAKFEVVSDNGNQFNKYTMAVIVNGQRFEEKGPSKKSSKAAVARSALMFFHNIPKPSCSPTDLKNESLLHFPNNDFEFPILFAENISRLINEKYISIMERYSAYLRRRILSGIVMSEGYNQNSCKVICVSTGTKCVNGERMSVNGTVLNDSHAEVISRRCLNRFFYSELEKHLNKNTEDSSIFERSDNGFRLKNKYKFHLYINSAPCGDSRIFSPHNDFKVDKHPNRKARGKLRTKIECGEGTIPLKVSGFVQTWDGVIQGERLLTMSCSDKIAKWNVVGLQGALLSNFIEPIYLESIVLGSLFHRDHLLRAVFGRIQYTIQGLPPPYRLNEPKLSKVLNCEVRQIGKTPAFSVNWTLGDKEPEIINPFTGKTDDNQISRLSKCKFFLRFFNLAGKIPSITGLEEPQGALQYNTCKQMAQDYQAAKILLFSAFSKAELGEWVKKPVEVDQFEWDKESLINLQDFSNSK